MSDKICCLYAMHLDDDVLQLLKIDRKTDENIKLILEETIDGLPYWFLHEASIDHTSFKEITVHGFYKLWFDFIWYEDDTFKLEPIKAQCVFMFPWER